MEASFSAVDWVVDVLALMLASQAPAVPVQESSRLESQLCYKHAELMPPDRC